MRGSVKDSIASKVMDIDPYFYLILVDYSIRYKKDFDEMFSYALTINDLTKNDLVLWMGFVQGKLYNVVKEQILPALNK